jgi:tetratricopeptide (TPR) repeat protein
VNGRAGRFLVALLVVSGATLAAARASAGQLPYAALLGKAYDAVLDARFEDVETELHQACGPAPPETCELVRVTATWWRIQLDPFNRSLDGNFQSHINTVIDAMTKWTEREPRRADAWFFLGAAYGVRVQYRVLRTERLSAARDGKRIKDALERALSLDPGLQDAYFGIGLYHYYADLGPAVLKLVRWLLFLPGGDRVKGLREMLQARDRGEMIRGEADYQLHLVYLWYEQKADEALKLLDELRERYPRNPLFVQAAAEVHDVYQHDHSGSLDVWRSMFNLARQARLSLPAMAEARARIGIADELDALFETDYSIEQLRIVVDARPAAPYGATARAALKLGVCHDRLGHRAEAVAAYQAAIAAAPPDDPDGIRDAARARLRRAPDAAAAEAYRLSIDGWRALQRGETAAARAALSRAATLAPNDPVTRYRSARVLLADGRDADALAAFEQVLALRPVPPPTVLASSCLEAARLREQAGDRQLAIELYARASRIRGAEAQTARAASQALARLRVPAGAPR